MSATVLDRDQKSNRCQRDRDSGYQPGRQTSPDSHVALGTRPGRDHLAAVTRFLRLTLAMVILSGALAWTALGYVVWPARVVALVGLVQIK